MSNKFKKGQIVKLKSGGPDMTIRAVLASEESNEYYCSWFAGKKLEDGRFSEETIELVSPKD